MEKIGFVLVMLAYYNFSQGIMKFEKETYDFGNVEEGPSVTYTFEFKNIGNEPIIISNVQASCGCTTPDWSKVPILPDEKGFIQATYSTAGRIGPFTKSVTITSNAQDPHKTLFIKGIVIPKQEKKEYTSKDLELSPKIELNKYVYNFGKIENGQKLSAKFSVKNTGKSDLEIYNVESACNCVSLNLQKNKLKPTESGTLELIYSPYGKNEIMDVVYLKTNDLQNPSLKIELHATIVESLTSQSPLKENNNFMFK